MSAEISEPHDPPQLGAKQDRVPRSESYVKDFRPMKLGTIRVGKGRGELTLRALKVPGDQVAEVQLLRLSRAE